MKAVVSDSEIQF